VHPWTIIPVRRNIRIPENIWTQLRVEAAATGKRLQEVAEDVMRAGLLGRAETARGTVVQQVRSASGAAGSAVVQRMPRSVHASDAAEPPRSETRSPSTSERSSDGKRVSGTREVGAEAVRGLRGDAGGEAPRGLQQTTGSAVVVPDTSSGSAETPVKDSQPWWSQKCRRCGFNRRGHRDGIGRCEAVPTCHRFQETT
jgi:hypothetical protein